MLTLAATRHAACLGFQPKDMVNNQDHVQRICLTPCTLNSYRDVSRVQGVNAKKTKMRSEQE